MAQLNGTGEAFRASRIRLSGDQEDDDDGIKRTSNWWTAAAFNITAIVGLGVLGIPNAMVFLSWGGVAVLTVACLITYFTLKQLVELHEVDPGKRYITYHSLGQRAFGESLGLWIVLPMQMVVEVSLDVLFTVAAGEAMIRIMGDCHRHQHIFLWFAAFGAIQAVLSSMLPNYKDIKWIAVVAALMSTCYSTIAWITLVAGKHKPIHHGISNTSHVNYSHPTMVTGINRGGNTDYATLSDGDLVYQVFNAMGVIAFAYAAHNVVLDIQTDLPSPSQKTMMKGVRFTYIVVALCYFPLGLAVYGVYGNIISHNVLSFMMEHVSRGWVIATNIMLIVHLIGSYQIFAIPVFKLLEVYTNYPAYIVRTTYIVTTTLIAMIFPYFSLLLGFFGGAAIAPTTYILPCVIWLRIKGKSKRWTKVHYINWACIVLGTLLMFVAIVGGLGTLKKQMQIYPFYNIFRRHHYIDSGFYPNCTQS